MSIFKTIYRALRPKDTSGPWREFARKNQGEYRYFCGDQVTFFHKSIQIVFSCHTHVVVSGSNSFEREYLRAIATFISPDNLQLKILPQDLIESIGKIFGSQDIELSNRDFDPEYMIKGNDREKIQLILSDNSIQKMLIEQRDKILRLELTDQEGLFNEQIPEGQSMLYFASREKVVHSDQLERLHLLFTKFLDQLQKTNSAKPVK